MKGTIFAVALNHRSQLDAWQEAFQQSPYKAPPKTNAVHLSGAVLRFTG